MFLANQVLDPRIMVGMVPPHGDRCLTVDLGPSTFIAMTIDLPTPSTMQVPRVGTPSGTTDPKATDHGSQRGYCAQPPRSKSHGKQASPPQAGAQSTRRGFRVGVADSMGEGFVRGAQAMAGPSVAVCGCSNTSGGFNALRS